MKLFVYNLREFDERRVVDELAEKFGFEYASTDQVPTLETAHLAEGCDYISIITTPINEALMKVFHEMGVRMISTRSIGVDHIDMEAAARYGVKVSHSLYAPNAVSDYAVMLMLMVNRRMKRIMQRAEMQDYTLKGIQGINMNTQTVGVIGTGKIGREVIRSLAGFGCRLLAYDLYENDEVRRLATYVPLEQLIAGSDIITLHMPLTELNFHMIDADAISRMKDGARIINTARGGLVDTQALIDGLKSGKLGGAGLDCIEDEFDLYYYDRRDDVLDHDAMAVLRSFPNVIVSPHMAFYTDKTVYDQVYSCVYASVRDSKGLDHPYLVEA